MQTTPVRFPQKKISHEHSFLFILSMSDTNLFQYIPNLLRVLKSTVSFPPCSFSVSGITHEESASLGLSLECF